MFAKVLVLALALSANAQIVQKTIGDGIGVYGAGLALTGGLPVRSALYGGLGYNGLAYNGLGYNGLGYNGLGYNGWGLGLGRVAGIGAPLIGGGLVAPAVSKVATLGAIGYPAVGVANHLGLAGLNVARGISVHAAGPVHAAVQTLSRTVDYTPVPYVGEPPIVQDVDVPPQESPLRINFQSRSSPLQVTQHHIAAEPGQVQVTDSEDEPQTAIHNVVRPVVQQVNEVIQPYRTLTQQVQPVVDQSHTNIAQGEGIIATGLTSGVVGANAYANGVGIAKVAAPAVGYGVAGYGVRGIAGINGLGVRGIVGGLGVRNIVAPAVGVAGVKTLGYTGLNGLAGYTGLNGLAGYATGDLATKIVRF